MWHVSIVAFRRGRVVPFRELPILRAREGGARARALLAGVGTGETRAETKVNAFHVRRALSPSEIDALDPAWRELPAIDMGG